MSAGDRSPRGQHREMVTPQIATASPANPPNNHRRIGDEKKDDTSLGFILQTSVRHRAILN